MGRIERKFMAHFIDTTFSFDGRGSTISWTPSWYRLGEDLEEYIVELEPIGGVEKNFRYEDVVILDGYEPKGEVDTFYAYDGDAMFLKLQDIIDNNKANASCLTIAAEVQLWHTATSGNVTGYVTVVRPCMIIPAAYGGDTSGYQILFGVQYLNNFTKHGLYVPSPSGGTFTET